MIQIDDKLLLDDRAQPKNKEAIDGIKKEKPDKIQILLVEDSIGDAVIFREYLSDSPEADRFWLIHTKRLSKAKRLLKRYSFDVVVLDLNLPDARGAETLSILSSVSPDTPVVILTGTEEPLLSSDYIGKGAQEFLAKSEINSSEDIVRMIHQAIERKKREQSHQALAKQAQLAAQWTSLRDPLTKTFNRRAMEPQFDKLLADAKRKKEIVGVLFIDLDELKSVNDGLGHTAGDALIKHAANSIRNSIRNCDTLIRFGGDEFVVGLGDIKNREMVSQIAARIGKAISEPIEFNDSKIRTTASIGISLYPFDTDSWEELVTLADHAMYYAKQLGKNEITFFSESLDIQEREMQGLAKDLDRALETGDQFKILFQPLIDLTQNKIVGIHPLLRWNHPERGELSPKDFLKVADSTGKMHAINHWLYEAAMLEVRSIYDRGIWPLSLHFNISNSDIKSYGERNDIVKEMKALTEKTNFPTNYLSFRVAEKSFLDCFSSSKKLLDHLREMGSKVILDDFAGQHIRLDQLRKVNMDGVIFHSNLINEAKIDEQTNRWVVGLAEMLASLQAPSIVKNVETDEEVSFAYLLKSRFVEGFHFGHPSKLETIFQRSLKNGMGT